MNSKVNYPQSSGPNIQIPLNISAYTNMKFSNHNLSLSFATMAHESTISLKQPEQISNGYVGIITTIFTTLEET